MRKDVAKYYKDFFMVFKDNPNALYALYEKIPDYVLQQRTDEDLWKDFNTLSNSNINQLETNESLSILNLLAAVFRN